MLVVATDVAIDLLREVPAAVRWAQSLPDERLVLPGVVALELIDGCQNAQDLAGVRRLMQASQVVRPPASACELALARYEQVRLATAIGPGDMLVAQTALYLAHPLHVQPPALPRAPGLQTIQPYTR